MKDIYSVSAVNQYIKQLIGSDYTLNRIYVRGEVSNCKYHSSGHIYFTLKDKSSAIACVMFSGQQQRGLKFRLTEGMQVIVLGSISVYERDGRYQLYAAQILKEGAGLLYEQFEALKRRLHAEGIFDESKKKPLPKFPQKLGIVTAPTGAAIQDMINVSTRRNPYIQLVFYPAKVQGDGAAETIVRGIRALDAYGVDVMIVGRGGGSMEDLWAFNEEIVARAIADCHTPVISAVGHETDVTIADFAADLRAPTPSAAAELAVPDILAVMSRVDECMMRMDMAMRRRILEKRRQMSRLEALLSHLSPESLIAQRRQQVMHLEEHLTELLKKKVTEQRHRLEIDIEKLSGLSPLRKLSGGYAYISRDEGCPVLSISEIKPKDRVSVTMRDGQFEAQVMEIKDKFDSGQWEDYKVQGGTENGEIKKS